MTMQSFSNGKESAYNVGDPGSIPGQENPLEKEQLSTLEFLLGEFHGQRSLTGLTRSIHFGPHSEKALRTVKARKPAGS